MKSSMNNIELPKCKCLRCGAEWLPRVVNPVTCPKCKSPYWMKPRRIMAKMYGARTPKNRNETEI